MAHAVVPKYVFVPLAEERQLEEEAEHVIDTTSIQLKSCESFLFRNCMVNFQQRSAPKFTPLSLLRVGIIGVRQFTERSSSISAAND